MTAIEAAVLPLKQKAIDAAEQRACQIVADVWKDLKDHNWDIGVVAPYPRGWNMPRYERARMESKYRLYHSLMKEDLPEGRHYRGANEPYIVKMCAKKAARFINEMKEMAASQYEAFVGKLVAKVGDHQTAELSTPTGVWDYSYVTVDGKDVWKTQCISKYSKLGKFFHQWPTRKLVKGSKR